MSKVWSIFTAVSLLVLQLCRGAESCVIRSSSGSVVERGSSFQVYCTFDCNCKRSMYSGQPVKKQDYVELNSTTIYFNVVNIAKTETFSCRCDCPGALDPCGLDIFAGYPPEAPKNISCVYNVLTSGSGVVSCTWDKGRDTYLKVSSSFHGTTVSGNNTVRPVQYNVSRTGSDSPSDQISFNMFSSVQLISVWVHVENFLGSAKSVPVNYTLSDIAMPSAPDLGKPLCSSRTCVVKVQQPVRTQHLEIQYRTEAQTWSSHLDSGGGNRTISPLEPYRLYHFRARSRFSSGLWSQWSQNISSWTQEEAPAKELDVWFAEPDSDSTSLRVYWKELDNSIARGKIIGYKVEVCRSNSELIFDKNISADARNPTVPFCAGCHVKVRARNSKGLSPAATIEAYHTIDGPPEDVHVSTNNHSVAISWRKPSPAPQPAVHVVEWYRKGLKLKELGWVRLGPNEYQTVITDVRPFECYEGAVYVFYTDGSVHRTTFTGITILESAPAGGPSVDDKIEGNKVKVTWTEIPRDKRGGCITKYTIYLEDSRGHQQAYSVEASERAYTLELSPGVYSLWMTASTAAGEGPGSQKVKVFIQKETQLYLVLAITVLFVIGVFLLCLCQISQVKQRFCLIFQCLMLDIVPDPKNSKWARECTQEKGKMNLQLQLSNSSATEEEEEPTLVDVEELPGQSSVVHIPTTDVTSHQLLPRTRCSPVTEPTTLLYPLTSYIKSLSQDSDSSDHTQTSLDTNTTAGYISSHGLGNTEEEEEEEEEEAEEFEEMMGFIPSHSMFMEPLDLGGKLTLDVVKINCNNFLQTS